MVAALEKAIELVSQLPPDRQETLASLILEEIESEGRWDAQFAASQDVLSKMAAEALAEHEHGETQPWNEDGEVRDN